MFFLLLIVRDLVGGVTSARAFSVKRVRAENSDVLNLPFFASAGFSTHVWGRAEAMSLQSGAPAGSAGGRPARRRPGFSAKVWPQQSGENPARASKDPSQDLLRAPTIFICRGRGLRTVGKHGMSLFLFGEVGQVL